MLFGGHLCDAKLALASEGQSVAQIYFSIASDRVYNNR